MGAHQSSRKVVVVHRGARDSYEAAAALAEAHLLDLLVTDLYWPEDRPWTSLIPSALRRRLQKRSHSLIPSKLVRQLPLLGSASFALEQIAAVSESLRRNAIRATDAALGRKAGRLARKHHALLLSYSYYGFHAFQAYDGPGVLFQLHPHPASVRAILAQELNEHPDCAASLNGEWELSLPAADFERLVAETKMAAHFIAASSFTRQTLMENGTAPEKIDVIPYGVDLVRFKPDPQRERDFKRPLRLLFVGTINQRKGIKYLVEALRLVDTRTIELTVCGRVVDDLSVLKPVGHQVTVRPNVSASELNAAYRHADLFVLPSVAEGFGHVLLESLASGLPILSTTHTAAPDLIENGREGFFLEPRRPETIAEKLDWAASNRDALEDMRRAARQRAEMFSWQRFRAQLSAAIRRFAEQL